MLLVIAAPAAASTGSAIVTRAACGAAPAGYARCLAVRVVSGGSANASPDGPAPGLHPADLQAAYNLDPSTGVGQTVAIVDAYDDPNAESDMAFYGHPGVPITVSSGDNGYAVPANEIPAAYETVTAVGGTSLRRDSSARGFHETVWSGAGSNCSFYGRKPKWQTDTGCAKRTVAD